MQHRNELAAAACGRLFLVLFATLFSFVTQIPAYAGQYEPHQEYIEALSNSETLDFDDPAQVLTYVLKSSPTTIQVQPTENYAYFRFYNQGLEWQGNMRLESEHGKADRLHFAYFVVPAPWHDEDLGSYKAFSQADGLVVTQNSRFDYTIQFGDLSRRMVLNDISQTKMPKDMLGKDEVYLGQDNDESGLRLFLVFDTQALEFAYILDESAPIRDQLAPFKDLDPRLSVGIRTGFVFLSEVELNRKRLIGVYQDNVDRNNYFDGPFDQLPDAYRGEITVREAFAQIDPEIAGEIDDFGNFLNQEGARIIIAPYLSYWFAFEFDPLLQCLQYPSTDIRYRVCIRRTIEQADAGGE